MLKALYASVLTDAQVCVDAEELAVADHKLLGLIWYGLTGGVHIRQPKVN